MRPADERLVRCVWRRREFDERVFHDPEANASPMEGDGLHSPWQNLDIFCMALMCLRKDGKTARNLNVTLSSLNAALEGFGLAAVATFA